MFNTEADDAADAERQGRAAAEKALALAPRLGEAHAALANLKWVLGDHVGSARDLREAIRTAPSSSDLNELYGRMLIEAGAPERGVAILAAAAAVDPAVDAASAELLRGRALLGDWAWFDGLLTRATAPEAQSSPYFFQLARMTTWRRDAAAAAAIREVVAPARFALHDQVLAVLSMVETGRMPRDMFETLEQWGRIVGRARRRPMFFRQLAAEVHAFAGDEAAALRSMAEADALGLMDVTWADRCPLFDAMRATPLFVAVRDRIAARARETLAALEGPAR
jgi:serine/threonine-protein kinase